MMKNDNVSPESLSALHDELKSGLKTLKGCIPQGVIEDREIKLAMKKKSSWLRKLLWAEMVIGPVAVLILLAPAVSTGMNLLCIYLLMVGIAIDLAVDFRTLIVPEKWIEEYTPLELAKKLVKQKLERQWQVAVEVPPMLAWLVWFVYEYYSKTLLPMISEEVFTYVWVTVSIFMAILAVVITIVLYKKAQRINDEMIRQLKSFTNLDVES